ncbi:MAG: dTDP-4-dehydrorhamnose reductase [Lachnospiraceae bacterium]|nr:dTDP-4-dehydrorhamnose reductase [Lachnospiraceae bacterium]
MRKILLTGANGQLGRAIRQVYRDEADFILTDMIDADGFRKLDISDLSAVQQCISETHPDSVINCAAMTNVDGCEQNIEGAFRANAVGPRNLAIATEAAQIRLVHVSTDYVFPGTEQKEAYTEFDRPAPLSAYGRTKLAGEEFVKDFSSRYFIFRTAWLYGDGHNFIKTMLKLAENHDELSVVMDQRGTPTSALELARLIHLMEPTDEYGVYHATCEGDTNWADFAEKIFVKAGKDVRVNHVTSEEYKKMNPASADRPKFGILDNMMLRLVSDYRMAEWEDALDEYLGDLLK